VEYYKKILFGQLVCLDGIIMQRNFRFAHIFEKYSLKATEDLLHVSIASSKHPGAVRILESYANPRPCVSGLNNCL